MSFHFIYLFVSLSLKKPPRPKPQYKITGPTPWLFADYSEGATLSILDMDAMPLRCTSLDINRGSSRLQQPADQRRSTSCGSYPERERWQTKGGIQELDIWEVWQIVPQVPHKGIKVYLRRPVLEIFPSLQLCQFWLPIDLPLFLFPFQPESPPSFSGTADSSGCSSKRGVPSLCVLIAQAEKHFLPLDMSFKKSDLRI